MSSSTINFAALLPPSTLSAPTWHKTSTGASSLILRSTVTTGILALLSASTAGTTASTSMGTSSIHPLLL